MKTIGHPLLALSLSVVMSLSAWAQNTSANPTLPPAKIISEQNQANDYGPIPKEELVKWSEIKYKDPAGDDFGFKEFKLVFERPISSDGMQTPFTECPTIRKYCVQGKSYDGFVRIANDGGVEIMYPKGKGMWKKIVVEKTSTGIVRWGVGTEVTEITTKQK